MHIIRDENQTDTAAGILTLEDDQGRRKHYVRRDNEATLPQWPDLVVGIDDTPQFARGHRLDGDSLPDTVTIARMVVPVDSDEASSISLANVSGSHEYRAEERAFRIWQQFRSYRLKPPNALDLRSIKERLEAVSPGLNWSIEEIERELMRWSRDKVKRHRLHR